MYEDLLAVAVAAARAGGDILRGLYGASDLLAEEKVKNDLVSRADRESEAAIVAHILGAFPDHSILAEESGSLPGAVAGFEWVIDPLDGTANFLHGVPIFCVSIACLEHGRVVASVVFDPLRDDLFTATRGGGAARNGAPIHAHDRVSRPGRDQSVSRPGRDQSASLPGRDQHSGLDGAFLATGFPFRAHGALDAYLDIFRDIFLESRGVRRCGAAALDLAYTAAGVFDGFFEFRLAPWDVAAGSLLIQEAGGVVTDLDGGEAYIASGNVLAGVPGVHRRLREIVARHASEAHLDRLVPAKGD